MLNKKKIWWLALPVAVLLLTGCVGEKAVENRTEQLLEEAAASPGIAEAGSLKEAADTVEYSEYEKGCILENGWESEWLGLRFTAPEGAEMVPSEMVSSMVGLGEEILTEDYEALQAEAETVVNAQEMMCVLNDQVTYVMMTTEKMSEQAEPVDYAASYEDMINSVSGIEYEVISRGETVFIGDKEFVKLACTTNYFDTQIYQDYYMSIVKDRMICIVLTYLDETAAEELLAGFSAFEK